MEKLSHFFECYFNISMEYEELENIIQHIENKESQIYKDQLIAELNDIIKTENYNKALNIMNKYGRKMSLKRTENFIKFLYNRFNKNYIELANNNFYKYGKIK